MADVEGTPGEALPGDGADNPRLVRQFTLTSGRTRPSVDLPMEATVGIADREAGGPLEDSDPRAEILQLCDTYPSIAELSAALDISLGVTRVLVGDLVALGKVRVSDATLADSSAEQRRDLIERTLSGLRNL